MGGDDGANIPTVEAYNPRTNTWRSLPLSQRCLAVAGVVGGRLVVAGGYVDGGDRHVEAYTPTGWTSLPPLPHAARDATACVLNGRLYVMGGEDCDKPQARWSEENGFSWTVKAERRSARHCSQRCTRSNLASGRLR